MLELDPKKMTEDDWRQVKEEAEAIIAEVEANESLKNIEAPPELFDRIMESVREYEEKKVTERFFNFIFGEEEIEG